MSEETENNNNGAGVTQPAMFGQNATGGEVPPETGGTALSSPTSLTGCAPNPPTTPGTGEAFPPAAAGGGELALMPALDAYAVDLLKGVDPESLDYQLFGRAREAAHKAGIPAEALGAVMGDVQSFIAESEAAITQARIDQCNDDLSALQREYASKFPAVMEACNNTLVNLSTEFGVDPGVFNLPELRNNPNVVKFFYGLSQKMRESGFAGAGTSPAVVTAEQELETIYSGSHTLSKAFFDSSNPEWKRAQERVNYLTALTSK